MNLECAICWNLLTEDPRDIGPPLEKRARSMEPASASSSGTACSSVSACASSSAPPPAPELCVPPVCGHMFHKICLLKWIRTKKNDTCPICRMALTENQLVTVLLPTTDEEKKCRNCKKTCEDRLTAENEALQRKSHEKEEKGESGDGAEAVDVKLIEKRLEELTKEKEQIEKKLELEVKKNEGLHTEMDYERLGGTEIMSIGDRVNGENRRLRAELHQERIRVQALEASRMEMHQRHLLLIDYFEEMTKKYQDEQEKGNILEGRVASLEAQRQ